MEFPPRGERARLNEFQRAIHERVNCNYSVDRVRSSDCYSSSERVSEAGCYLEKAFRDLINWRYINSRIYGRVKNDRLITSRPRDIRPAIFLAKLMS